MKPSITVDFLRGILFAYVAYHCYLFINALWIGFFPIFQPLQAGSSALLLTVYLILFVGLLFRPARSAKPVFIFLSLFCLLPIASGLVLAQLPAQFSPAFALHHAILYLALPVDGVRDDCLRSLSGAADRSDGLVITAPLADDFQFR